MSKQIYWAVVQNKPDNWGGKMLFPKAFYKQKIGADLESLRLNKNWRKKEFVTKRYLLETKDAVHYDVYKHEYKRI